MNRRTWSEPTRLLKIYLFVFSVVPWFDDFFRVYIFLFHNNFAHSGNKIKVVLLAKPNLFSKTKLLNKTHKIQTKSAQYFLFYLTQFYETKIHEKHYNYTSTKNISPRNCPSEDWNVLFVSAGLRYGFHFIQSHWLDPDIFITALRKIAGSNLDPVFFTVPLNISFVRN